jgi:AcrR family transcriptional regulator
MTATEAEGASRRRGRPGYDLESVLEAAVEVFNERGYDGASMEDLSKRLGIAKSAIYHHVSGKEELLRMALDRALDGWSEAAEQARALDAPAIVRLEMLVRGTVVVLESRLPYVTLLLRVRGNTDVERAALARRRSFDLVVASLVEEAERDGDVRADVDPKVTARLVSGLINSIVEWYRPGSRQARQIPLADAVCAIAFDGLRVRSNARGAAGLSPGPTAEFPATGSRRLRGVADRFSSGGYLLEDEHRLGRTDLGDLLKTGQHHVAERHGVTGTDPQQDVVLA